MTITPLGLLLMLAFLLAWPAAQAETPLYKDPAQPVSARVEDLLARMTLAEKVGQMTQINVTRLMGTGEWDRGPLNEAWLERILIGNGVGSLLSGGGAAPLPNTPRAWAEMTNALQRYATENSRLGIPLLYGTDAVHGHNNVGGATIFPHNLGLAASWQPELAQRVAQVTARDLRATGVHWNFAPVADLGRDPRWGRFYETFG
ncbi:MAG: beta-glucosidase, partial [Deinococcota bacterium]|nr:beta-glucosidase [Deinococcota bacterium]